MGTARALVAGSGSWLLHCQSRALHPVPARQRRAAAQHVPRMELEGLEVLGEVRHGGSVCRLGAEGINGVSQAQKSSRSRVNGSSRQQRRSGGGVEVRRDKDGNEGTRCSRPGDSSLFLLFPLPTQPSPGSFRGARSSSCTLFSETPWRLAAICEFLLQNRTTRPAGCASHPVVCCWGGGCGVNWESQSTQSRHRSMARGCPRQAACSTCNSGHESHGWGGCVLLTDELVF